MNIRSWKIGALLGMAGVLCAVAFLSFMPETEGKPENNENFQVGDNGTDAKRAERRKRAKRRRNEAARTGDAKKTKEKPKFALDDDDEARLNEEQRKTIAAIRAALDAEDSAKLLKLVQKLQASDEWPDGIPKSIKMAAVEALGWFGSKCLPEIAGFLGDGDSEVVQSAIEKYEDALSDFDLSDYDRAKILIEASKVINDADAMESMLFELINMRNSVAAATMKELMVYGNAATKSVLPESIEFITGEENITTPEQIDEWAKQNPDDPDDDDFYGGSNNSGA